MFQELATAGRADQRRLFIAVYELHNSVGNCEPAVARYFNAELLGLYVHCTIGNVLWLYALSFSPKLTMVGKYDKCSKNKKTVRILNIEKKRSDRRLKYCLLGHMLLDGNIGIDCNLRN